MTDCASSAASKGGGHGRTRASPRATASRGCRRRTTAARSQVTGGGVDGERLVLGQPLPLLRADPRLAADPLVAAGQRDHRGQRHRHEMDPAADGRRRRAQQVGERQRLRASHVIAAARRLRALHRRQHRTGQVSHVHGLLEPAAAAGHRQHQR